MAPRENLDTALLGINEKVMEMGQLVEQAIREATRSIKEKDQAMARAIIDGDEVIDDMEDEIRKECFRFLATQAPVAGDLRYAISTMGAVRDLEFDLEFGKCGLLLSMDEPALVRFEPELGFHGNADECL